MLPSNNLSQVAIPDDFLPPDDEILPPLSAKELGGVGLFDSSQGLQVRVWEARYFSGGVYVSAKAIGGAPAVTDVLLFERPGITEIDLTFDQNMFPSIAFTQVESGVATAWHWWFSIEANQHVFTQYPGAVTPRVTLDDKRGFADGRNDIILTYLRDGNLYIRIQRDRYEIEYLLDEGVEAPRLGRFGMATNGRLQWEYVFPSQAPDLVFLIEVDDTYTADPDLLTVPADKVVAIRADAVLPPTPDPVFSIPEDPAIVIKDPESPPCQR